MSRYFAWKAVDSKGIVYRGKWDLADQSQVSAKLREQGYIPVRIRLIHQWNFAWKSREEIYAFWIALIFRLTSLLEAGVPLLTALEMLARDGDKRKREDWRRLIDAVQAGHCLSDALRTFPPSPPAFVFSFVKYGEASGSLLEALDQAREQLEQEYSLINKIKKSLSYPLFLLGLVGAAFYGISIWVLPLYENLYSGLDADLPLLTRTVFSLGNLLPYLLGGGVLAGISAGAIVRLKYGPGWREKWEEVKRRFPLFGGLYRLADLVQCTSMLGRLLAAGIGILEAIRLTGEHLPSPEIKRWAAMGVTEVGAGLGLNLLFRSCPRLFPSLACDMLAIGEKTGQIESMLAGVSGFYRKELYERLDSWQKRAEPLLILCAALVVGVLAVSVLLPVFDMSSRF